MPEYLSPGVYVEEVDTGAKPIEGVSTSTAGMVGMTQRGPTEGLPELVTSFSDFKRKFGGFFQFSPPIADTFEYGYSYLPYAVDGFFQNGGKRLYIKRVSCTDAVCATKTAKGGLVTRLKKDTSVSDLKKVTLKTLRGIEVNTQLTFTRTKNGESTSAAPTVLTYNRRTGEVTLDSALPSAFEERYTSVKNEEAEWNIPATFSITAKNKGYWGNKIDIRVEHECAAGAEMESLIMVAGEPNRIKLRSTAGFYVKAWIEIDRGLAKLFGKITKIDGSVITLETAPNPGDLDPQVVDPVTLIAKPTFISTCEFKMSVSYEDISEEFSGLTLENIPGRYYKDIINNNSELIDAGDVLPSNTAPWYFPSGDDGLRIVLGNGSDGGTPPDADAFRGADNGPGNRTGIEALKDIDQISIIAAPGITTQVVQEALINQCELLKDRFAVLDPENKQQTLPQIQEQRQRYDTKYAAIYYPRIMVYNPFTKTDMAMAPSGHITGIYARIDIERGVHKAPANEVIRNITGLEQIINKGEQDILNPKPNHVNVLRDFRESGRGYRVWGARCITSDPDWKYINVRRLFIYVEESIEEGTQWVVFEPNDEPTWARVRTTVTNFLTDVWRDGALQGRKPAEAFFVRCDRTTMSQTDIDNGKLIMLIGIAPVKPAEFVIFRIGQWAGGSKVEEA